MVGTRGFEPPTSCTPCKRSTRLNYVPKRLILHLSPRLFLVNHILAFFAEKYVFALTVLLLSGSV